MQKLWCENSYNYYFKLIKVLFPKYMKIKILYFH